MPDAQRHEKEPIVFKVKKAALALVVVAVLGDATVALAATAAIALNSGQPTTEAATTTIVETTAEAACDTSFSYPWPFGSCPPAPADMGAPETAQSEPMDESATTTQQN
jgi:hypothetical protein